MDTVEAVELYTLLKDKLGDQETKALLRYVRESTPDGMSREEFRAFKEEFTTFKADVREEFRAMREEFNAFKAEVHEEFRTIKADVQRLELELVKQRFDIRLYFAALAGLILVTNPKVIDLLGKLMGLVK